MTKSTILVLFVHAMAFANAMYFPDYSVYHDLSQINQSLDRLSGQFPALVQVSQHSNSSGGRPLLRLSISDRSQEYDCQKARIIVSSGEHAREFVPVESAIQWAQSLAERFMQGHSQVVDLLETTEIVILPMINPDGRALIESKKDWCWRGMGNGVDVNRNFPHQYAGPGSSDRPDSEEYRGSGPLSEPETRFLDAVFNEGADAYLSLHSGAQQVFYPFADSKSRQRQVLPENHERLQSLADAMNEATGHFFTDTGATWQKNDYAADGTAADWAYSHHQIPLVYTFEVFGVPGDLPNCFEQFNPGNLELPDVTQKLLRAYDALAFEVASASACGKSTTLSKWENGQSKMLLDSTAQAHNQRLVRLSNIGSRLRALELEMQLRLGA